MDVVLKIPKPANKTWNVKGKTVQELLDNIERHGWAGLYLANPSYAYKQPKDIVTQFTLKTKPLITTPKWSDYSKATKDEKKSWDKAMQGLKKHENNHHEIFCKEAKLWKAKMKKMGDLDKGDMESEWGTFMKLVQGKQDTYDTKTQNGVKEGARMTVN